jgi:hypothetical protein
MKGGHMNAYHWTAVAIVYGSLCWLLGAAWASRPRDDDIDWEDAA